ncbi:hypothetical protein BC835DRAFT_161772 [Cytidiella melzeri]|nr:hypothetical protein BC835DRAFT_161772 [Cytidiella melzeri]
MYRMGETHYHEMPYDKFMALFLLPTDRCRREEQPGFADKHPDLEDARARFQALSSRRVSRSTRLSNICEGLNMSLKQLALNSSTQESYVFKDVSERPETKPDSSEENTFYDEDEDITKDEDSVVDIAMYPTTQQAQAAYTLNIPTEDTMDVDEDRKHTARIAWAWMTMGIKVKRWERTSAFSFREDKPNLLQDTKLARKARAGLEECVSRLMARQHRTFVFVAYICRNMVRITRWDRNGCLVSTPIDLTEDTKKLLDFVHSLSLMSNEELGYDTTAILATPDELEELKSYKLKNPYAAERAKEILDNQLLHPVYKVRCPNVDGSGEGVYFIGKHSVTSYSPTGRATKGYIAFNQQKLRLCFLKDYWVPNTRRIRPELTVYKRLQETGVRHVATALGGGYVANQCTVTQKYLVGDEVLLQYRHYRLAMDELARPLENYKSSSEMILVVYDALQGHEEAWTKAGILHRDISASNIMRVVDQDDEDDAVVRGILNDWDLCKYESEMDKKPTQHNRSGTWAFMSAVALRYPFKPNDLADDLEAFVHVISHFCLRFHLHKLSNHDFGTTLEPDELIKRNDKNSGLTNLVWWHFDENADWGGGIYKGGSSKLMTNTIGLPDFTLKAGYVSPILVNLLDDLYDLLKMHYSEINFEELKQYDVRLETSAVSPRPSVSKKQPGALVEDPPICEEKAVEAAPESRVLDTHAEILAVFRHATDMIAETQPLGGYLDVTQDQFIGLRELAWVPRYASSSTQDSGSTTTSEEELAK